ncbi:MAG TPA: hypothetical protein PK014_03135 [Thermoanaerobaculia bacterium]|nr:hypothetical protein [Thermoanaerobaculia bacterium]HUM29052.1 hypothetical protein [Thermoanaerobaculia bacterium]HXK67392.1 hypothetical protein [Thermoanaerobaculia bacterium]
MEKVLGVPRERLKGYLPRRNLLKGYVDEVLTIGSKYGEYRSRSEVETDPDFKQLIPYVFLTTDQEIFIYRRLTGGGEKRLHNLVSLGIGGHVNDLHEDPEVNWCMNMAREIHEELHLTSPYSLHPFGILNEDITDVCTVHLGMVYEARVHNRDKVSIKEKGELEGDWHSLNALEELYTHMEVWSKILCETITGKQP